MAQSEEYLEIVPITMQELRVLPVLCKEPFHKKDGYRYCDTHIESFGDLEINLYFRQSKVKHNIVKLNAPESKDGSYETIYENRFKKNCGEWIILDNPILAVVDNNCYSGCAKVFTPVAIMNVTQNGDNAFNVFLPLSECCYGKNSGYYPDPAHYYHGGFSWEERPFEQIMNMLRKDRKIGYTFFTIDNGDNTFEDGGGFRVFDT